MRPRLRRTRLIVPTIAVLALLLWAVPAALGAIRRAVTPERPVPRATAREPSPPDRPSAAPNPSPTRSPLAEPTAGPGTWNYLDRQGPVLGLAGRVQHFRVAVERGIPYPVDDFAAKVQAVLGDPRSWIASGS